MDQYTSVPKPVNSTFESRPGDPPTLGDLRARALEAQSLASAVAEGLTNLPASALCENLQALANVNEEKAKRTFEIVEYLIEHLE